MFIDTIGLSWRGFELVLQQSRHSTMPLVPTLSSMSEMFVKAKDANAGVEPFHPFLFDYPAMSSTLYRMTMPKLNFDLSTEFRNSAPDNVFELWRLLIRKLDPPRADLECHLTSDIWEHARTIVRPSSRQTSLSRHQKLRVQNRDRQELGPHSGW